MPVTTPSAPGKSSASAAFSPGTGTQPTSPAFSVTAMCDNAESRYANKTGFAQRDHGDSSGAQVEKISSLFIVFEQQQASVAAKSIIFEAFPPMGRDATPTPRPMRDKAKLEALRVLATPEMGNAGSDGRIFRPPARFPIAPPPAIHRE